MIANFFSATMGTITEQIKALRRTPFKFTLYQVETAEKIYKYVEEKDFKELGKLVCTIKSKTDYKFIHYAFYQKHEYGWLYQVQKSCTCQQCVKYGFYNYNF